MTDTPYNRTRINQVGAVFVPVADQDRALEFYVDKLGFEQRADFSYGEGSRWVEVAPPGAANTIALVPPSEGESAGGDEAHCAFATDDIEADHATLRANGVDLDAEIARGEAQAGARLDRRLRRGSRAAAVLLPRRRRQPVPDRRAEVIGRVSGHFSGGGSIRTLGRPYDRSKPISSPCPIGQPCRPRQSSWSRGEPSASRSVAGWGRWPPRPRSKPSATECRSAP